MWLGRPPSWWYWVHVCRMPSELWTKITKKKENSTTQNEDKVDLVGDGGMT